MENERVSVNRAYHIMHELGLVSQIETVRKWIREGKLEADIINKRSGYQIKLTSLESFIKDKQLTALKRQQVYQKGFKDGYNQAETFYKMLGFKEKND